MSEMEDELYMMMPLASNANLNSVIKNAKNKLSEGNILNYIFLKLCQELHNNYITHRDLKPENILMLDGLFKICDFGVSVNSTHNLETFTGTYKYMAPEVKKGCTYNKKVDIW